MACRAPNRGLRASPLTSRSRTARCRCGRSGASNSTIASSSMGMAEQGPADHLGQVVVTDRQRVGVAERALRRLSRRPHPDAGQRGQRLPGLLGGTGDEPLQRRRPAAHSRRPCGPGRGRRWRGGTPTTGCGATPRRRGHAHSRGRRTRRGCAELGDQQPPGPERVLACHPLLDHGRDQRLQHPSGAAQPQMRHPPIEPRRWSVRRARTRSRRRRRPAAREAGRRIPLRRCPMPRTRWRTAPTG